MKLGIDLGTYNSAAAYLLPGTDQLNKSSAAVVPMLAASNFLRSSGSMPMAELRPSGNLPAMPSPKPLRWLCGVSSGWWDEGIQMRTRGTSRGLTLAFSASSLIRWRMICNIRSGVYFSDLLGE